MGTNNDNSNQTHAPDTEKLDVLFRSKNIFFEPSPYLKSKVLMEFNANTRIINKLYLWKKIAFGSFVTSISLITLFLVKTPRMSDEVFEINTPFIVKISLEDIKKYQISEVEVELPQNVSFYSKNNPQLAGRKVLRLEGDFGSNLPFVVSASERGRKAIKVRFFDKRNSLLAEQILNVTVDRRRTIL